MAVRTISSYIVGRFPSLAEVVNPYKAIVEQLKTNTFFIKLGRQLVMAVVVELQTESCQRNGR